MEMERKIRNEKIGRKRKFGRQLALSNFTLNSHVYSSIYLLDSKFYGFIWDAHLLSIFSLPLSLTSTSYRKTVAPAPGTRCVCIILHLFPCYLDDESKHLPFLYFEKPHIFAIFSHSNRSRKPLSINHSQI